jgi:hypothetical protein
MEAVSADGHLEARTCLSVETPACVRPGMGQADAYEG